MGSVGCSLNLVIASWYSDLIWLRLKRRRYSAVGTELRCSRLSKTANPGQQKSKRPVCMVSFNHEPSLRPVGHLKTYESAAAKFRQKNMLQLSSYCKTTQTSYLFLNCQVAQASHCSKRHKQTFYCSLCQKCILYCCGDDGLAIREVMDRADWSTKDTFCKI